MLCLTIGNVLAALAFALAACAHKRVCRALIRWRAAKLPPGEDAERAREELEGFAEELSVGERAELALNIVANAKEIRREVEVRSSLRRPDIKHFISVLHRHHHERDTGARPGARNMIDWAADQLVAALDGIRN